MFQLWINLNDWIIIFGMIVVFGGNACLLHYLCFRKSSRDYVLSFTGIVPPFFAMAATIFALTTALLGSTVWQNFHDSNQAIKSEGQALTMFIELNHAIPQLKGHNLTEHAKKYTQSAVEKEWDLIKSRQKSVETDAALMELMTQSVRAASIPELPVAVANALMKSVDAIAQARAVRLSLLSAKAESARWLCVLLLGLLTQVGVASVHLEKSRTNALALTITTLTIIVALGLIALADSPHSRAVQLSNDPLHVVLKN